MTTVHEAAHQDLVARMTTAYRILQGGEEQARALVKAAEHLESAGIVLDPTMLRDYLYNENAQTQVAMAKLSVKFVEHMGALIAKLPAGAEEHRE